ncbi:MAG: hypothetical protein EPO25_00745 [Gammaproteobacteria bacterium]|nr:MAG: hypothetical protein EPO25_00745 [Gammaproteobacteria bacterium]
MSEADSPRAAENGHYQSGTTTGLFAALSRLLATFVAIVQTRVQLLSTEIQEEVHRAAAMALWALLALFTVLIGLMFGGLTIVFAFWDTHRVLAALLVTAGFLVFAGIAVTILLLQVRSHQRFLDATLTELARDAEALRHHH